MDVYGTDVEIVSGACGWARDDGRADVHIHAEAVTEGGSKIVLAAGGVAVPEGSSNYYWGFWSPARTVRPHREHITLLLALVVKVPGALSRTRPGWAHGRALSTVWVPGAQINLRGSRPDTGQAKQHDVMPRPATVRGGVWEPRNRNGPGRFVAAPRTRPEKARPAPATTLKRDEPAFGFPIFIQSVCASA